MDGGVVQPDTGDPNTNTGLGAGSGGGVVQLDPSFYSFLNTLAANSDELAANSDEALRLLAVALGGLPEPVVIRVPGELDPSFNSFLDTLLSRWPPETTGSRAAGPLAFEHSIEIRKVDETDIEAICTMEGVLVRVDTVRVASQ